MALFYHLTLSSNGRPLSGASITIYDELPAVPDGGEDSGFVTPRTIYSDAAMSVSTANPLTANDNGEASCYIPSGEQVAVKVSRTDYGSKWHRRVDITGSDSI